MEERSVYQTSNSADQVSTVVQISITTQEFDRSPRLGATNEILTLTLRPRSTVTWEESVVNNEGLNRRSSKRCCIFHKKRDFGESSTDSDEGDHSDHDSISGSSSSGGGFSKGKSMCQKERGKIAHKRRNEKNSIPDFQRYHA